MIRSFYEPWLVEYALFRGPAQLPIDWSTSPFSFPLPSFPSLAASDCMGGPWERGNCGMWSHESLSK